MTGHYCPAGVTIVLNYSNARAAIMLGDHSAAARSHLERAKMAWGKHCKKCPTCKQAELELA